MDKKALIKKIKRMKRRTLSEERKKLQDRQAELGARRDVLTARFMELSEDLDKAINAKDGPTQKIIMDQKSNIKDQIESISKEFKQNAEILKIYAEVRKDDRTGASEVGKSIVTALTGFGTLALAAFGLSKGYSYDEDGKPIMKNRTVLEFFSKIIRPDRLLK
jgi:hypothetical protein